MIELNIQLGWCEFFTDVEEDKACRLSSFGERVLEAYSRIPRPLAVSELVTWGTRANNWPVFAIFPERVVVTVSDNVGGTTQYKLEWPSDLVHADGAPIDKAETLARIAAAAPVSTPIAISPATPGPKTRYVIRTDAGAYLRKGANTVECPNPWAPKPKIFVTRKSAETALATWKAKYPSAGLHIEVREPLAQTGAELSDKLDPVIKAYREVKKAIEKLPKGKMRALALIDLESSFSRAIFAASEMKDVFAEVG